MRSTRHRAAAPALVLAVILLSGAAGALAVVSTAPASSAPRGIHLSITDDARTAMTVAWFTNGSADPGSVVEFGDSSALGRSVHGASQPVPGVDARVHEATMTGLAPGQTVHYRVGGASGFSDVRTFRTDDGDATFRAVVWGDHGTSARASRTLQWAIDLQPDVVLIAGDISYANGDQPVWDEWFDLMEPLASRVAVMPVIGNHEEEGPEWGTRAFETRFALPGEELFYGFDYGTTRFTMHDSDTVSLALHERLHESWLFLADELAAAAARRDAGALHHLVVVQHHPLYGNHPKPERQFDNNIAWEEAHLHKNGVKLVVAAHNHHYERSKPMAYGVPTEEGMRDYAEPLGFLHVTTGGGGESLYDFRDPNDFGAWSAAHAKRYHLTLLEFSQERIEGRALDTVFVPGDVFDTWSLTTRRA